MISFSALVKSQCWKNSFGRDVGVPISSCGPQNEKDAGLCYPLCKAGYVGLGPVCWESCRVGY